MLSIYSAKHKPTEETYKTTPSNKQRQITKHTPKPRHTKQQTIHKQLEHKQQPNSYPKTLKSQKQTVTNQ